MTSAEACQQIFDLLMRGNECLGEEAAYRILRKHLAEAAKELREYAAACILNEKARRN